MAAIFNNRHIHDYGFILIVIHKGNRAIQSHETPK